MKFLLLSAGIACGLLACQSSETGADSSADTTAETNAAAQDTGWISLFDGETLNGWHSYGKSSPGTAWNVDSGAIHLNTGAKNEYQTQGGGDLVSDEQFDNFDLKLEWKISKNGNSGIIFYVQEDTSKYKETWNTGLEMQVLDNNGHSDGKIPKHRAANLYDLIAASPETAKGSDEWNQVEIISNNGNLEFHLNGAKVLSTTLWDNNWNELVAASKFKDMPGWGTFKSGHIALQDHGDEVWYRNVMIKRL